MLNQINAETPSRKGRGSVETRYVISTIAGKQARLQGRSVLIPDFDLGDFRCEAVFDWVKLRFGLEEASNEKTVRQVIRNAIHRSCWVEGLEGSEEYEFEITVQQPSKEHLQKIEDAIQRWRKLAKPISVSGVEVSVDFYPTKYDHGRLAVLTGLVMRHHLPSREVEARKKERPRFSWGDTMGETLHVFPFPSDERNLTAHFIDSQGYDNQQMIQPSYDATLYAGEKGGDVLWRIMMKEIDKQNRAKGTSLALPDNMKRVRIEVTLREKELRKSRIDTVADLCVSKLQRLQGSYFQFKLPSIRTIENPTGHIQFASNYLDDLRLDRFRISGVLGLRQLDTQRRETEKRNRKLVRERLGRKLKPLVRTGVGANQTMVSYQTLSKMVADALCNLGRRK